MNGNRGQILPLAALILLVIAFLIGINAERLLTGIRKIRQQRQADSLVLIAVNEQARALNAIAALNQKIKVAQERAYLYAIGIATTAACYAASWGTYMPCLRATEYLVQEAIDKFYPSLKKFGQNAEEQQKQIATWAAHAPRRAVTLFNLERFSNALASSDPERDIQWAVLFPEKPDNENPAISSELHIAQGGSGQSGNVYATQEEADFAATGQVSRCDETGPQSIQSEMDLGFVMNRLQSRMDANDEATFVYEVREGTSPFNTHVLGHREIEVKQDQLGTIQWSMLDGNSGNRLVAVSYHVNFCEDASDYLPDLGLPPFFDLKQAFQEYQKLTVAVVTLDRKSILADFLPRGGLNGIRPDLWSLSEARVAGGNLQEMEFHAVLSPVTRHEQFWDHVGEMIPLPVGSSELGDLHTWAKGALPFDIPDLDSVLGDIMGLEIPHIIELPDFNIPQVDFGQLLPSSGLSDLDNWLDSLTVDPPAKETLDAHLAH